MRIFSRIRCAGLLALGFFCLNASAFSAEKQVGVLVLPFEVSSPESLDYLKSSLSDLLASRIGQTSEVHVFDPGKVKDLLGGRSPLALSPEEMTSLAQKAGARYLLLGRLTKIGEPWSIDAALFDPFTNQVVGRFTSDGENLSQLIPKAGELADSIRRRLVLFAAAPPPPPPSVEFKPQPEQSGSLPQTQQPREGVAKLERPWISPPIPMEIRSIAVADVDGDGRNEIIVLGKSELQVYQWTQQTGMRLATSYKSDGLHEFLVMDAADLNGNRLAEIYITAKVSGSINSLVLEWNGQSLATIASRITSHLRVIDLPGQGPTLLSQGSGVERLFEGPIRRMAWRGRELTPLETLPFPAEVSLASLAVGDINADGRGEVLFIDHRNLLLVYDQAKRNVGRGAEGFGQTHIYVVEKPGKSEETEVGVYLPGRVLIEELVPGQPKTVIAAQNQLRFGFFGRLRLFVGGEVVGLNWENQLFEERWRTERRGAVADFRVARLVPRGEKMLVVGSVLSFGGILGGSPDSRIMVFSTNSLRLKR